MESISTSVIKPHIYPSFEYLIVFVGLRGCVLLPLTLPPPPPLPLPLPLPPPQASPATLAMRWQAGGCVAPFHTAVSLLIMTNI